MAAVAGDLFRVLVLVERARPRAYTSRSRSELRLDANEIDSDLLTSTYSEQFILSSSLGNPSLSDGTSMLAQ